jgi:hypothetical protein
MCNSYIININLKDSEYFIEILLQESSFLLKKFKLDIIDTDFLDKCEPVYDNNIKNVNEFMFRKALWRTFNVNRELIKNYRSKKSRILTYKVWETYKDLLSNNSFI